MYADEEILRQPRVELKQRELLPLGEICQGFAMGKD